MAGRLFYVEWQEDTQTLFEKYRKEHDSRLRQRWQALWLLRQGKRLAEAADHVGVHYRTVQDWVGWYRRGGLAEVAGHRLGGPRRKGAVHFSTEQEEAIRQKARTEGFATIGTAIAWVAQVLGATLSVSQMRTVFGHLGLAKKVPRPISQRASLAAQEEWKRGAWRLT